MRYAYQTGIELDNCTSNNNKKDRPQRLCLDFSHQVQKELPPTYVQDEQKVEPHDHLYPPINHLLNVAPPIPCTLTAA